MEKDKLGPLSSIIGTFSFIVFGITGYMNLRAPLDITNIVFGVLIGLIFGFISKLLFAFLLSILNRDIKVKYGKGTISKTVRRSAIFMFPYAALVFLSTYFLGWAAAGVIYSAAIMNTGIMASTEIGKLKGKPAIRNTIATSIMGTLLSYFWLLSANYLKNIPDLLDSAASFLLPLMGVNK